MTISRREAREILLGLVFQFLFLNEKENISYGEMLADNAVSVENKEFISQIYSGVCDNFEELTKTIRANVKDFSPSQVFKMDYSILLIACYEILHQNTEHAIVINEAVNLAKKFSTDKSSSFVNGVLSSVLKGK